jgi:predicted ATPase
LTGVSTNWVVITGAPSSGKTSVIDALALRGYAVQGEVARAVIERHLKEGKTLAEIRRDESALQREMLEEKIALEKSLDPAALVFLDRAMDDSITYTASRITASPGSISRKRLRRQGCSATGPYSSSTACRWCEMACAARTRRKPLRSTVSWKRITG